MALLLHIETATTSCSVSLSKDHHVFCSKEDHSADYSHAEELHGFIKDVMNEGHLSFSNLDAIAVSKGPGSYTGLRIGTAAAKGLCLALNTPLIAVPTLESLAHQIQAKESEVIIPVLNAGRGEVYSAVFDANYQEIRETRIETVSRYIFEKYSSRPRVHVIGNGAGKCDALLSDYPNFKFYFFATPSAREMALIASRRYNEGQFENATQFTPFYAKDFVPQGRRG